MELPAVPVDELQQPLPSSLLGDNYVLGDKVHRRLSNSLVCVLNYLHAVWRKRRVATTFCTKILASTFSIVNSERESKCIDPRLRSSDDYRRCSDSALLSLDGVVGSFISDRRGIWPALPMAVRAMVAARVKMIYQASKNYEDWRLLKHRITIVQL